MNLADKPVYARPTTSGVSTQQEGITYKEALVLALSGNHTMIEWVENSPDYKFNARILLEQADAIIKEMEKE